MADNFCKSCGVSVSSDLSNCPLCGKYVLEENQKIELNKYSYPKYDYTEIVKEKKLKMIRNFTLLICVVCLFINLIFITKPFWFPYVVAGLLCLYLAFIHPFRHGGNLIKNMSNTAIYIALFLIFLDAYGALANGAPFGWGYAIAAPCTLAATVTLCTIISFTKNKYNTILARKTSYLAIFSIIYFIIKFAVFPKLPRWPSLVFVCSALSWFAVMFIVKPKTMKFELGKDFHI